MNKKMIKSFASIALSTLVTFCLAAPGFAAAPKLNHTKDYIPDGTEVVERRGACLSPDGKTLYLTGLHDRAVYSFSVASGELTGSASLSELNPDAYGKAVTVGPDGDVWAPACSSLEIFRFSKDLSYKATYSIDGVGAQEVEGILVAKDNSLFIPDRKGNGGIYKASISGDTAKPVVSFGKSGFAEAGAEVRQPALGPDGSVYVGDFSASTIYKVDSKTGKASVFTSKVPKPYHLSVDGAGRVYAAQYDGPSAVTIIGSDGTTLGTYSNEDLGIQDKAAGITVNSEGTQLFVVDQKMSESGGAVKGFSISW